MAATKKPAAKKPAAAAKKTGSEKEIIRRKPDLFQETP
jgi:hypothetical protein